MRQFLPLLVVALVWVSSVQAQNVPAALPVRIAEQDFVRLRDQVDATLQRRLEARLSRDRKWRRLITGKKLAVGLVDMTDPSAPRFARVNGNEEMYAASLPKIAVLLAAEQAIEDGHLELTPEVDADMHAMIRKSSNTAATAMIDRVGLDRIASTLRDPRYDLYDPETGGGLWVGKRYASTGPRYGDELKNISHAATVAQVCRYYYLVATGRLVSFERSRHMLSVLSNPGINHKLVHSIRERAPRARLFRKSGSWRNWHSDSILVWGPEWRRYILVVLVEDPDGEKIVRNVLGAVEDVLRAPAASGSAPKSGKSR